jgi:membrane associated rhomboid family serine protease
MSNVYVFSVYRAPFSDPLFYVRLFTHVLGHASFEHFFNNFIIILLIGPILEEKYGSRNLLILMVITAFVTGILHIILSNTMLLGASGIVFFMILLASYTNFEKGRIPVTLVLIVIIFIGREVMYMVTLSDNVAQLTHILGGVVGALGGYVFNRKKTV